MLNEIFFLKKLPIYQLIKLQHAQKRNRLETEANILKGAALTKVARGAGSKLVGNRVVGNTLDGVIVTADQDRK